MKRRKKILLGSGILAILLVLLPVFLLSSPMLDVYQRRIDRDPASESSRSLQLTTADLCFSTWRYERAATGYRLFYERYKGDERRAYSLLRYAQSLDEAGRTGDAIDTYRKYLLEYPDIENRKEAQIALQRLEGGLK